MLWCSNSDTFVVCIKKTNWNTVKRGGIKRSMRTKTNIHCKVMWNASIKTGGTVVSKRLIRDSVLFVNKLRYRLGLEVQNVPNCSAIESK